MFAKKKAQKIEFDREIYAWRIYHFFPKIGSPKGNFYNSANFEAVMSILFHKGSEYLPIYTVCKNK